MLINTKKFVSKMFVFALLLVLTLVLIACDGGSKTLDLNGAKDIYTKTVAAYVDGTSVDVKFSYSDNKGNQTIVFKYNLEGNKIKDLAYVVNNLNGELSIYVKDGVAYMNAYGTKSTSTMTDSDYATFMEKYTFKSAMEEVNSLFGYTFYTGASVKNAYVGKIELDCDLSKLSADPALDDDKLFEMEENLEKLKEKKALTVEYTYGDYITKLVGVVTEQDDSTKTFTVEFNANSSVTIDFPSFESYKD
ncbi:MAG: hypothetical protein IJS58_02885 [Bacilli bacterium]|nr:hypothetical protein [Bacilli bacterium]